jgi:energy-coupling factor transporter ATP-binding protein EcfA2
VLQQNKRLIPIFHDQHYKEYAVLAGLQGRREDHPKSLSAGQHSKGPES